MLPGFRFLFAAIVFSMSLLVFGLGAAALLRAAHEEFASIPSWHAAPESVFARENESTRPMLALLNVEPLSSLPKVSETIPAAVAPVETPAVAPAETPGPGETATIVSVPAPPATEKTAALKPEDSPPPEPAKPEIPVAESPAPVEAAPAQAEAPAAAEQTRTAAAEQALPPAQILPPANPAAPAEPEPSAPEQASAAALPETDIASTKIATLGGPAVSIEPQPPQRADAAKPDSGASKKRQRARRAAHRRAARARLTQQSIPQQPGTPFNPPVVTARSR
jgi:hypothetical protein